MGQVNVEGVIAAGLVLNSSRPPFFKLLEKGKVEGSQFCFAAGTIVHTKNGLVPIEQVKVGDWVLSRHDNNTGKQAYKRVLKTIQSDETKPIIMLRYYSMLEKEICQLYVTNEHPIFVKDDYGQDVGWRAASTVSHPDQLVSFDGTPIEAFENCTLWVTPKLGVAWGQSRVHDYGPLVDFSGSMPKILEGRTSERAMEGMFAEFEAIVYNLEVEDFHTYYVGELGIWVHNTSSGSGDVGLINKKNWECSNKNKNPL